MNLAARRYAHRAGLTEDTMNTSALRVTETSAWAGFHLQSSTCFTGPSEDAVEQQLAKAGHGADESIIVELPEDLGTARPVWLLVGSKSVVSWSPDRAALRQHRTELGDNSLKLLYLARL